MPWRSPLLAAVMSAVVIGSGLFFVKRYLAGAISLGAAILLTWAIINYTSFWALLAFLLLTELWVYQITLAYDAAVEFDWNAIFEADSKV